MMENRISISPNVCNGRPVITGTRITVQTILEFLGSGDSGEEVLEEYPSLLPEDIYACMQYASKLMANRYEVRAVVWMDLSLTKIYQSMCNSPHRYQSHMSQT